MDLDSLAVLGDHDLAATWYGDRGVPFDDRPVTTALLSCTGPTAGVHNVATPATQRGKGFGAAATWAVVAEGARRDCTHAVLQSSPDGYPIYRAMGFVDVGRYLQMEGSPP